MAAPVEHTRASTPDLHPARHPQPSRSSTLTSEDHHSHVVKVYLHQFSPKSEQDMIMVELHKRNTTEEMVGIIQRRMHWPDDDYDIYEAIGTIDGQTCKERRLDRNEYPVAVQLLWPKAQTLPADSGNDPLTESRFVVKKRTARPSAGAAVGVASTIDAFLAKFLQQPKDKEYPDLCLLPELTEQTLLDNLRDRFNSGHIYTYIGPILVAMNPFKFFPIYNPKYAKLYQNRRLGSLPPHIFAIADTTYHNMLRRKQNQCIVISGESGSGKTESTNFLLHHLTTLSQKGTAASSLEQTLLCAGPVLEAFGNAVTAQNNNSSRFGKFIQVNYRENGMVTGANVQIYLLEKSRIISQAAFERNYHVFYYVLQGATEDEHKQWFLMNMDKYHYLNQNDYYRPEGIDETYEFKRLRHSMELVGFGAMAQRKIFTLLSAVLLLGNVQYVAKKAGYHADDAAHIANEEVVAAVSQLLEVKQENLITALTTRKTVMGNETVVTRYKVSDALNTRDAMAKCLYNALFNWIVLRMNQALLKRDIASIQRGYYIGILDIFGFEDIGAQWNSFEQFCINYANERLQAYFNQHIFQFEQEEYLNQGIAWTNIEYTDNTECLQLMHQRPYGLFSLIDEESSIAKGTDESLLQKFNEFHKNNEYYEAPQKKENAFIIAHYAGKVKYQITNFRDKNKDTMRIDVVNALKNSKSAFVRELVCSDPVAAFRWAIVRASFRALSAFKNAAANPTRTSSDGDVRASSTGDGLGAVDKNGALLPLEGEGTGLEVRRRSESQLSLFLRGELNTDNLPSFVDRSVFTTIVDHVKRKSPKSADSGRMAKGLQSLKILTTGKKQPVFTGKKQHSVGAQFQMSLSRLMDTLANATPYFIRCIKSNNDKIPVWFDEDIILRQLRYTGMLETVRIRRAGYSVRIDYDEFALQYRIVLPQGRAATKEDIMNFIYGHPSIDRANVQFGFSKIFMRDAEKLILDDQLHRTIMAQIVCLQRWFKTVIARKRFQRTRSGVIKVQAAVRGMLVRERLRRETVAALVIQTYWRAYIFRGAYGKLRDVTVDLQAHCRGYLFRKKFTAERDGYAAKLGIIRGSSAKLFQIQHFFQKFELPSFDIQHLDLSRDGAGPAAADEDLLKPLELKDSGLEDDEEEDSATLDAEFNFILEDCRLKLVGKPVDEHSASGGAAGSNKMDQTRRQSLAAASSARVLDFGTLRRVASTENEIAKSADAKQQAQGAQTDSGLPPVHTSSSTSGMPKVDRTPSSKSSNVQKKRSGFFRAKQHLKNFLSNRKSDSLRDSDDDADESSFSPQSPPSVAAKGSLSPLAVAGHSLESSESAALISHTMRLTRIARSEMCSLCQRTISGFFAQGYKCTTCKLWVHKECQVFANKLPCRALSPTPGAEPRSPAPFRRPWDVGSLILRSPKTSCGTQLGPTTTAALHSQQLSRGRFFNLTRTQQQIDPQDQIVASLDDLKAFSLFIFRKQTELQLKSQKCRDTQVDAIYKKALREFHTELISFEAALTSLRKKRRRSDVTVVHMQHRFGADIVHVPTYCEVCNEFMWHAEKIFICQGCRISCHKKCHSKLTQPCSAGDDASGTMPMSAPGRFFGAELSTLIDDDNPVPVLIESILLAIELRGLFVEGIYRKSGSIVQIKQMRRLIETTSDSSKLRFDDVPVHVLTALVKMFFREMSEPLMTYDLYENFLNVSDIEQRVERVRCLYVMVELLPKAHKAVLDRLMYHLARVAHQEEVNRMCAPNLATIFAPCLLRRAQVVHAQEQLQDVNRQAVVIEALIEEKLRQYRSTMEEIVELEHASEKVTENLRKIDDHVLRAAAAVDGRPADEHSQQSARQMRQARQLFVEQLEFLDKEKDRLIEDLPPLAPVAAGEDDCVTSSDDSPHTCHKHTPVPMPSPSAVVAAVQERQEEYAIDLSAPPLFSKLRHLTKTRPRVRHRPPSDGFLKTILERHTL